MFSRLTTMAKPRSLLAITYRMTSGRAIVLNPTSQSVPMKTGGRQITVKTLCEITGTRYYMHNEEVNLIPERVVRVFDEHDILIGDMTFDEAYQQAKTIKQDIVLRNANTDPPVVKITNYRKDLMRKLFTKLGESKPTERKEQRAKAVHLTTTITAHDLQTKKRKANDYFKQN